RPYPAGDYDRGGDQHGSGGGDNDPLAELARLIGQTDPFGPTTSRPAAPARRTAPPPPPQYQSPPAQQYPPPQPQYQPSQDYQSQQYQASYEDEEVDPPAGPPSWMQRANLHRQAGARRQPPADTVYHDYAYEQPNAVHPVHRYAAQAPAPAYQNDSRTQQYDEPEQQPDPSRYDDALYGQIESGAQDFQRDPAYPDDP